MAGIQRMKTAASAAIPRLRTVTPPLICLLQLTLTRTYGTSVAAAAQPQFDYEYYTQPACEQPRNQLPSAPPMVDSEGSVSRRGVQWAFLGSPVTKKHIYAEKLSKLLEVPHISMVSLVRQDLSPRSSLYKQIANAVNNGEHVPEDIVFGLLSKRLEDGHERGESGFILDGIPRSRVQAEILDQIDDIDLVVNFKCTDDWLKEIKASGISSPYRESCGTNNSAYTSLNIPSQHTQPKSSTVTMEKAWKEKLQTYAEQIKPLEDYYRRQKKLLDFQVGNVPGETWQGLLVALHLQHMNAAHSTQKLTAGSYLF